MSRILSKFRQIDFVVLSSLKAIIKCWPVAIGIMLPTAMLVGTGQGLELIIGDSVFMGLAPSIMMAILYISALLYFACVSRLGRWRTVTFDYVTTFCKIWAPEFITIFFISTFPALIIDATRFPVEVREIFRNVGLSSLFLTVCLVAMLRAEGLDQASDWDVASYLKRLRYKCMRGGKVGRVFGGLIAIAVWGVRPKFSVRLIPLLYVWAFAIFVFRQFKKRPRGDRIYLPASRRLRKVYISLAIWSMALIQFVLMVIFLALFSDAKIVLFSVFLLILVTLLDWWLVRLIGAHLVTPKRMRRIDLFLKLSSSIVILIGILSVPLNMNSWVFQAGAIWTLFFSILFWVSIFTLISFGMSGKALLKRVVSVGAIIFLMMVLSGPYFVSDVRLLPVADAECLTGLDKFVSDWLEARRSDIGASKNLYPIFFVAAEGGGIRAAYWSSMVLAALHDDNHAFTDHTFALSGVSGGAIGVGVFSAMVDWQNRGGMSARKLEKPTIFYATELMLVGDLLSPPLGASLIYDPVRSALQSNLLPEHWRVEKFPDRSEIFENNLEKNYRIVTRENGFAKRWDSMWGGSYRRSMPPLVISNISRTTVNDRVVLTPFSTATRWSGGAVDATSILPIERIAYSTALYLSARFPVISTTGRVHVDGKTVGLTDGGFSDNSGTATVKDLVDKVMEKAAEKGLANKVVPCVIDIENGNAEELAASEDRNVGGPFNLLETAMADRLKQQAAYKKNLRDDLIRWRGGLINEFSLPYRGEQFPLGWALSSRSRVSMWFRLDSVIPSGQHAIFEKCLRRSTTRDVS